MPPDRMWRRLAFWAYAIALFVGTHWPRLEISVPGVQRPDLFVHFTIFALWSILLYATMYFAGLGRWRGLGVTWLVAVVYAAIDEALQGIPSLRRNAAWDDLAANIGGITLGLAAVAAWVVVRERAGREQSAS